MGPCSVYAFTLDYVTVETKKYGNEFWRGNSLQESYREMPREPESAVDHWAIHASSGQRSRCRRHLRKYNYDAEYRSWKYVEMEPQDFQRQLLENAFWFSDPIFSHLSFPCVAPMPSHCHFLLFSLPHPCLFVLCPSRFDQSYLCSLGIGIFLWDRDLQPPKMLRINERWGLRPNQFIYTTLLTIPT